MKLEEINNRTKDAVSYLVEALESGQSEVLTQYLCQAAWMLAGGESPVADHIKPVFAEECYELIDNAKERWKNPEPIPGWCCDGTHCAGSDVRFMGMWQHMYAVCKAFEPYGRVDPNDEWLPAFQCYDGLIMEKAGKSH
jgi:hypothetical protein